MFEPKFIAYDFALANIKANETAFPPDECTIDICLFHIIQSWWKRATILGLRRKKIFNYSKNSNI